MFTFLGQRKQAKMQWLLDPNQSNVNNLHNARRETSEHYRNKKKEYLKTNIDEIDQQIQRLVQGYPYVLGLQPFSFLRRVAILELI
jgi:hypothetical protein